MSLDIRRCEPADFAAWVEVANAVWPEHPTSVELLEFDDRVRASHCRNERLLAWLDGRPIGLAAASQHAGSYDPRRFDLEVGVLPANRRAGVGAALYEAARAAIADAQPNWLIAYAHEGDPDSDRFLRRRGYESVDRELEQVLEFARFDPAAFEPVRRRAIEHGIAVRTLPELGADPDWEARLRALSNELDGYVPSSTPTTDLTPDLFRQHVLENPHLIPEAFLVATAAGDYIGLHNLWRSELGDDRIEIGITAVQPAHRRKGVATLLKLRGLEWAKAHGIASLRTWNAATNVGMLAINRELGFEPVAVWLGYHWRPDSAAATER